jgi:hypothetical protein
VEEGAVRAGDRAPDARLLDPAGELVRLFDVFRGPHFTLLAFGGAQVSGLDPRHRKAVRVRRLRRPDDRTSEGALTDRDGAAHRIYGDGLFVVRPDGYVGYAGRESQGPARYLARFFG